MEANMYLGNILLESRERKDVVNPATGERIGSMPIATQEDVEKIVNSAVDASKSWEETTVYEREILLMNIASKLKERTSDLLDLMMIESGKTKQDCLAEINGSIRSFEYYAHAIIFENSKLIPARTAKTLQIVHQKPYGAVALLTPWNFPLSMLVRKAAPALAAGNTIIVKPSDKTPLIAYLLLDIINEVLPAGVFNVVTGKSRLISEVILKDARIRKLSFTGSTPVGKSLYKSSGDALRKLSLELGGNAPFIVTDSADLETAATELIAAKIRSNGQVCIAPNRIYVHEAVYDDFVTVVKRHVENQVMGDPSAHDTTLGPLINIDAVQRLEHYIHDAQEKGAYVAATSKTGTVHEAGTYLPLTLLVDVKEGMLVYDEEIFGPVIAITKYADNMAVVATSNQIPYGLAAYMYTKDASFIDYVVHNLEAGMIGVNTTAVVTPETPFGGIKESGFGRENGIEGLHEFLEPRFAAVTYKPL